ncbi:hematopoietic progenitor cell antigen CD34 [Python bivittatus]|uniref:Hematopoietic progenitor cell antigen CD34 n=1 Tax=Python bivittatus TaxID=176946 RepID=A0A9F2NIE5_PYTBI|nr:hematopoietic progenitor cell antigen CD34 [Python bivittatus]
MMLVWSFKIMKKRQLLWATFCVLCLLENPVSGDESNSTSTSPTIATTEKLMTIITTTSPFNSTFPNSTTTSPEVTVRDTTTQNKMIFVQSTPTANLTSTDTTAESFTTKKWIPGNETTQNATSIPLLTSDHFKTTTYSTAFLSTAMTENGNVMLNITCVKIKKLTNTTEVICLELDEVHLCENFKTNKGEGLSKLLCEKTEMPCLIELAESDVNRHCMLLLAVNKKGAEALDGFLEPKQHSLTALGIKSYKREPIETHQAHSRKTLIALVTTGLLLAFLGLAGYYLMKRRSWSPMGERLGEDPYYIENDSHGNPVIPVASHEQSDLQNKPNLNGGARENGTGQPTSKNGHSTRPQVVADTEL